VAKETFFSFNFEELGTPFQTRPDILLSLLLEKEVGEEVEIIDEVKDGLIVEDIVRAEEIGEYVHWGDLLLSEADVIERREVLKHSETEAVEGDNEEIIVDDGIMSGVEGKTSESLCEHENLGLREPDGVFLQAESLLKNDKQFDSKYDDR
jgi:hypothetical protein